MNHVTNPPALRDGKLMYVCGNCGEDIEAKTELDIQMVEEYEKIFNRGFFMDGAEEKVIICEDCWNQLMRVN